MLRPCDEAIRCKRADLLQFRAEKNTPHCQNPLNLENARPTGQPYCTGHIEPLPSLFTMEGLAAVADRG